MMTNINYSFARTSIPRACLYGVLCFIMLALTACAKEDSASLELQEEKSVDDLYNEALDAAYAGDLAKAAPLFEEVERQHPYSLWALRAQVMSAWAFYQNNNYAQAEIALDRFVELYPADPLTQYAYYLKALVYYEQIVDVERDAHMTYKAKNAFEELLRRFPGGTYARDAQLKLDLTLSHLAGKEMAVGRFYLKGGFYPAAIKRFTNVVEAYDNTNQVPEALYRLGEAYMSLGLVDEASRTFQVALYNFPHSAWTDRLRSVMLSSDRSVEGGLSDILVPFR